MSKKSKAKQKKAKQSSKPDNSASISPVTATSDTAAVTEKDDGNKFNPVSLIKSASETVVDLGEAIGGKVVDAGKAIAQTTINVGGTVGHTAYETGESALKLAADVGDATFKQSTRLLSQATTGTGQAVSFVGDSPLIRKLTRASKLEWLLGVSDQVDVVKATEYVRQLKQKYPDESPSQIAHRIMVEKAMYAGGVGLASSLVPGEAIALLAVDLATTTALQTEMLYQIAAVYGLDLKDPARKGEALAIFGLALGGSRAIRAGLVFVKNLPFAGALIGASANATMIYALGYAACRFYEAKLDPEVSETADATLEDIHQKSESYLEVAIAQQAIMDQILAHMLLASYPNKAWEDILPSLQSVGLHPNSLEAISRHLASPQPLGALLDQLNRDFAVMTLSHCYTIARLDEQITPEKMKVLEAISEKFDLDLETVKSGQEKPTTGVVS